MRGEFYLFPDLRIFNAEGLALTRHLLTLLTVAAPQPLRVHFFA